MRWTEHVFRYCERGFDPGFWAEPVNALSNAAFLLVAALAAVRMRQPGAAASGSLAVRLIHPMIALVALIGAGSFLFHVMATRWAQMADVLPIAAFIVLYLIFALRCLAGLSMPKVALGVAALLAAFAVSMAFCPSAASGAPGGPGGPTCLNDTIGYAPALAALFAAAVLLRCRSHPAASRLLPASAVLLLSMVMRTIDLDQCSAFSLGGRPLGSHFVWHLLNALVLHLLLTAAVDAARRSAR